MADKPTYEELEQMVKELEEEAAEHNRAEENLQLQSQVAENMAEGVYLIRTSDGTIVYANKTFERMFGYDPGELVGKHVSTVNAPSRKRPEEIADEIIQSLKESGTWSGEVENIKKDGMRFWCHANVSTFDHHDFGEVWVSVHEDITKRKQVEEALRESEEKWRSLTESSPDHIMLLDRDYNIQFINYTVPGLTPEEVIGRSNLDFVPPDERQVAADCFERVVQSGKPDRYEIKYITAEGQTQYFDVRVAPMTGNDGSVVALIGSSNNVTERKRMEEVLQESEHLMRQVFDTTPNCIFVKDRDGRFILANEAMAELYGMTPEAMVGKTELDFLKRSKVAPKEVEQFLAADREVIDSKKTKFIPLEEFTRNGKVRWFQTTKLPLALRNNPNCVLGVAVEVTERKQAEQQIKTSLKEKELLLREIHHRVKNNFQIISSLLDMIKMRTRNQEAIDLLTDARSKIYTMALVHTQLYEQERFDGVDMGSHIRKLVDYLSQTYGGRGKSIHTMIEASDVYLEISQAIPCALVLSEIISNAFKHAFAETQKGTIEIFAQRSADNTISISVEDDGMGIPEEIDIYKVNSLGLKLIRNIVEEQLMGKVQVERSKGTNISIEFEALEEKARHV